jgi:hypothetical protein
MQQIGIKYNICNVLFAQRWLEKIIFTHNLSFNMNQQCL